MHILQLNDFVDLEELLIEIQMIPKGIVKFTLSEWGINKSDIIIVATPHKAYKNLKIKKSKVLVDIWGLIEKK